MDIKRGGEGDNFFSVIRVTFFDLGALLVEWDNVANCNSLSRFPTDGGSYTICMYPCPSLLHLYSRVDQLYLTGDFFIPAFQCPHHVERIGVLGDGGKWVCGVERVAKQEKCVIYSFGAYLSFFMITEWLIGWLAHVHRY
jgi:Methyltransferase domain